MEQNRHTVTQKTFFGVIPTAISGSGVVSTPALLAKIKKMSPEIGRISVRMPGPDEYIEHDERQKEPPTRLRIIMKLIITK